MPHDLLYKKIEMDIFCAKAKMFLKEVRKSKSLLVVANKNKPTNVIMNVDVYNKMVKEFEKMEDKYDIAQVELDEIEEKIKKIKKKNK